MSPETRATGVAQQALRLAPLLATGVVALAGLGIPGFLLLLGWWACARATAAVIPQFGVAATWAAGVGLATGLVLGGSAVAAALGVDGDAPAPQVIVLVTPAAIGLAAMLVFRLRAGPAVRSRRERTAAWLALAGTAAIAACAGALKLGGAGNALAWAMSGDARNHTYILRRILASGGLTLDELQTYPAGANAVAAVVAGVGDRSALTPGELLAHDVGAIATVYFLAIIAAFVLTVAVVHQFVPATRARVWVPFALAAGSMVVSPLVLGTALQDGFFSAYVGIPLALASVVLAFRGLSPDVGGRIAVVALAPMTVLIFATWTLLVVLPAAIVLGLGIIGVVRAARTRTRASVIAETGTIAAPILTVAALALLCLANLDRLRGTFALSGAIMAPDHMIAAVLALTLLSLLGLVRSRRARWRAALLVAVMMIGGVAVVWLATLAGPGLSWTYYPTKTMWLIMASLSWIPFTLAILVVDRASRDRFEGLAARVATAVSAASLGAAIVVAINLGTAAPSPVAALDGRWTQPSATIVEEVIERADDTDPFVFWGWSDPGNDRIGNFWAGLTWSVNDDGAFAPDPAALPGGVVLWAYFSTDMIDSLCELGGGYPGIVAVTHQPTLARELGTSCGESIVVTIDDPRD